MPAICCTVNQKRKGKARFRKVVLEQYSVPNRRGGGLIKIEAWENDEGKVVKYSMAYINHLIFPEDNGRVIGYDNTHNHHHKHYFGKMSPTEGFINYQELVSRFEKEIKEFVK